MSADQSNQTEQWHLLYDRIVKLLARYGMEDAFGAGDYLVVDDNYGWKRITIEIHHLKMLNPNIISALHGLLTDMPGWQIVIAVDIPGKENEWPVMGLTIRQHEIIDGLVRRFLPQEFRDFAYSGSKPGTGYD